MKGNVLELLQQFEQFKKQMQGNDPKAMLDMLIQSGRVSKEDINKAEQMAQMFKGLLH